MINGLWRYLFNHDDWHQVYKVCYNKTNEEWTEGLEDSHVVVGYAYLILGIIFELLYIPVLTVMIKGDFLKHSCYKFMVQLTIIDMITISCNAIITGLQCINGYHFCANSSFYYPVACVAIAGWHSSCLVCILLGIDRFFEICFPHIADFLFKGKRTLIWLLLPICYAMMSLGNHPGVFYVKKYAWYWDPFFDTEFKGMPRVGITYQSLFVGGELFLTCLLYLYMEHFWTPDWINIVAHIGWIFYHGDTPIIYMLLNKTMRMELNKMFKFFGKHDNTVTVLHTTKFKTQNYVSE